MILSNNQIIKVLISLGGWIGWSASLLFANTEDKFSHVEARMGLIPMCWETEKFFENFYTSSLSTIKTVFSYSCVRSTFRHFLDNTNKKCVQNIYWSFIRRHWMLWKDCANIQACLSLHWLHMSLVVRKPVLGGLRQSETKTSLLSHRD